MVEHIPSLGIVTIEDIKHGRLGEVQEWFHDVTGGDPSNNDIVNKIVDARDGTLENLKSTVHRKNMTALNYAAFYGQYDVVNFLMDNGADPSLKNVWDYNALHCALQAEYEDDRIKKVVHRLVKVRVDVDVISKDGWTPLLFAIHMNLPETFTFLMEDLHADPTLVTTDTENDTQRHSLALAAANEGGILKTLLKIEDIKKSVNAISGRTKSTALHLAVFSAMRDNVQELVQNGGADVCIEDAFGRQPIHYSARAKNKDDFKAIIEELKHSLNAQNSVKRHTILHSTVLNNRMDFVKVLLDDFNSDITLRDSEGRFPLHYLCEQHNNEDLVHQLANRYIIVAKDNEGYCPLHFAVMINDSKLVRVLLRTGEIKSDVAIGHLEYGPGVKVPAYEGFSALHLATVVKGSDQEFVDMLESFRMNQYPSDFIALLNAGDCKGKKPPLQLALEDGMYSRVETLLNFGADMWLHKEPCADQLHLIHLAAVVDGTDAEFKSLIDSISKRLKGEDKLRSLLNAQDGHGRTALHLAIERDRFSRVKILLDFGADAGVKESSGKNSLHYAFIQGADGGIVRSLLNASLSLESVADKKGWIPVQHLNLKTPASAIKAITVVNSDSLEEMEQPLSIAIGLKRFDLVKVLLIKDATISVRTLESALVDGDQFLAYTIVRFADSENLREVLSDEIDIPNYGEQNLAALVQVGPRRRIEVNRHYHYETTLFRELISRMPKVAKEALERCVTVHHKKAHQSSGDFSEEGFPRRIQAPRKGAGSIEERDVDNVHMDYTYLHPKQELLTQDIGTKCCGMGLDNDLADPLLLIVNNEQIELLQHPVVRSYVYEKWKIVGLKVYLLDLLMYFFFLGFLSLFVLIVNHPLSVYCSQELEDCGGKATIFVAYCCAVMVMLLAYYHIIIEIFWLVFEWRSYFYSFKNYVRWVLFILAIILAISVFTNDCGCLTRWQWQIAIAAIVLAWMNFLFVVSNFPIISIYVIMFSDIIVTFLNLTLFAILLISAFSLVLFMMFHNPSPTAKIYSFSNIGISFISTMNMLTGGLSFETIFGTAVPPAEYTPIPFHVFNFLIWIIFLIMFPIIFKNMLTSLAVDDVQQVRKKAELRRVELQVIIFADTRLILSLSWLRKLLMCLCLLTSMESSKTYMLDIRETGGMKCHLQFFQALFKWLTDKIFGKRVFLDNVEDDTYEQGRLKEMTELMGTSVDNAGLATTNKLNDLYDLVQFNLIQE